MPAFSIRLLTVGAVPAVAPVAATSNITSKCNGGTAAPNRFCQRASLSPSAANAVLIPVMTRLSVSRLLQALLQLTSNAPAVAHGTRPISTAINQELGGSSNEGDTKRDRMIYKSAARIQAAKNVRPNLIRASC